MSICELRSCPTHPADPAHHSLEVRDDCADVFVRDLVTPQMAQQPPLPRLVELPCRRAKLLHVVYGWGQLSLTTRGGEWVGRPTLLSLVRQTLVREDGRRGVERRLLFGLFGLGLGAGIGLGLFALSLLVLLLVPLVAVLLAILAFSNRLGGLLCLRSAV